MINTPESGVSNSKMNSWFNSEDRFSNRLDLAQKLDTAFAAKYKKILAHKIAHVRRLHNIAQTVDASAHIHRAFVDKHAIE